MLYHPQMLKTGWPKHYNKVTKIRKWRLIAYWFNPDTQLEATPYAQWGLPMQSALPSTQFSPLPKGAPASHSRPPSQRNPVFTLLGLQLLWQLPCPLSRPPSLPTWAQTRCPGPRQLLTSPLHTVRAPLLGLTASGQNWWGRRGKGEWSLLNVYRLVHSSKSSNSRLVFLRIKFKLFYSPPSSHLPTWLDAVYACWPPFWFSNTKL